jgi:hypothetical protein
MEKKRQHIVPRCYQKAWCDPATPPNQEPYIWLISRDGSEKKKRAPAKTFVGTDIFTIRLPDGTRELVIEETLERIENNFVRLIERRISKQYDLDPQDRANLCIFTAAMFARVDPQARTYTDFLQQVHGKVKRLEELHNAEPKTSLTTGAMLENARAKYVAIAIQDLAELYAQMPMAILVAPETDHFITSDSPTVWFNPQAYKLPPLLRAPGLDQADIEVSLPLTPRYLMFLSHRESLLGYRTIPGKMVQEINRRTRAYCDEWFVSWEGEVQPYWFERGTQREDRWENTPEGKQALERKKKFDQLRQQREERFAWSRSDGV